MSGSPEALVEAGWAALRAGDAIELWERAYAAHRRDGDHVGAAT